jgi:uncharacterized RDD family membrane protein YckC
MGQGAIPPPLPHERLFAGGNELTWGERRPRVDKETLPKGWQDLKPHPWRRYFARQLDTTISGLIAEVVLIWGLSAVDPEVGGRVAVILSTTGIIFQTMIIVALAVVPNALILGLSGSSLGKWIFGIRVQRRNGRPIGVFNALQREIRVLVMGLGLGIPLISLITMIASFTGLVETGQAGWDRDMENVVAQRPNNFVQVVLSILGIGIYVAMGVGLVLYTRQTR